MSERRVLPYGSWPSPITIDMAVASSISLREPRLVGSDVFWTEGRPEELGRQVIVRWNAADGTVDVTPSPFYARTMANEYGGGWYTVGNSSVVYFTNLADGRIYRQDRDATPVALTGEGLYRYADLVFDRAHDRVLCIREDHTGMSEDVVAAEGERIPEPTNTLVAVDGSSGTVTTLAAGYDFYSTPRPSADGRRLAWLAWHHPNMPWDATELWVADTDDSGRLKNERMIAGGDSESVIQPEWTPDGSLVFVSDRSGWWNLYRWTDGREQTALLPMEAEFCGPQWVFGMSWFGIAPDSTIVATAHNAGRDALWLIPVSGAPRQIELPDEEIDSIQVGDGRICYVGAGAKTPRSVVLVDFAPTDWSMLNRTVLRSQFELTVDAAYLSTPEAIEFPTTDGQTAHALYYPPTNRDYEGPANERPPLIVQSHGGPTSSAGISLDLEIDLATSRGFAVVDVDYRGSNGYGREYMRRLDGKWGIYDVDDCIAAAKYLAERSDVDPERMAIRGGSAGGYTTLCALTFHDVFAAGASYFGVGDLEALARDTHKFESRYLDRMVAPYPEGMTVYRERSPIHFVERLSRPLIVLQGIDDKVVPVAQAERIVEALRRQRIPHVYLAFEGEGHGFRQAANIRRSMEAELSFYAQVFGFTLADDIEPVKVEYLAG
jgi:dipeptidyl aminopeptidase/acylaminoacyl peptidase